MTTAAHAAAGAAVGAAVGNPLLALLGGVASHVILDVVPHYDLPDFRVDTALTVLVGGALVAVAGGNLGVLLGVLGGVAPDLENLAWKLGWIRDRFFPTHVGPLPHGRNLGRAHAVWQLLLVAGAFWLTAAS